jgi:hypothetical protein
MRFQEFQDLNIHPGQRGKLTPNEVLQYLTSRGLFRVGLEFTCPNCELAAWVHLDNVETNTTCEYCGLRFDVTPQLKDRTWRYRRSGLFGRADDQQGSIPVALALQQLEASLRRSLLMYSTALIFRPHSKKLETCEADFVAAVAGNPDMGEAPVQILLGEAKTNSEFDDRDLRKLGKLADAIPSNMAEPFVMFAKANDFTEQEISLARASPLRARGRLILWSRNELEPTFVYERSKRRLEGVLYAPTLTEMVHATDVLWFGKRTEKLIRL